MQNLQIGIHSGEFASGRMRVEMRHPIGRKEEGSGMEEKEGPNEGRFDDCFRLAK